MSGLAMQFLLQQPWAMLPEYVELLGNIVARDGDLTAENLEAITLKFGNPVAGSRTVRTHGAVGVLPVSGPLTRYANFFSNVSGLTSYEQFARDLDAMLEDDEIRHIVVDINSPGGQVDGMTETMALVRSVRDRKPMTAYGSFFVASAAYGLASQFPELVVNESAIIGSIGTVMTARDSSQALAKRGIREIEFVSAQSEKKRQDPFHEDPEKAKEGIDAVQALVNSLADVLIQGVVEGRSTTREEILAVEGGVLVGQQAIDAGLADELGTLEGLIARINDTISSEEGSDSSHLFQLSAAAGGRSTSQEGTMSADGQKGTTPAAAAPVINRAYLDAHHPELVSAIGSEGFELGKETGIEEGTAAGATAERDRILGIQGIEADGFDALKAELMADPAASRGDAAMRILTAKGEADAQQAQLVADGLKADEVKLEAEELTAAGLAGEDGESEEAVAASVLGHANAWAKSGNTE